MKKFKKGQWIIATKVLEVEVVHGGDYGQEPIIRIQKDVQYTTKPVEILHVASHHYVIEETYYTSKSTKCITFDEVKERDFVRATSKMVELITKEPV